MVICHDITVLGDDDAARRAVERTLAARINKHLDVYDAVLNCLYQISGIHICSVGVVLDLVADVVLYGNVLLKLIQRRCRVDIVRIYGRDVVA